MIDADLLATAARVLDQCRRTGLRLALAESCTGGLVAATLTEIPGSSDVLDRGFVTYSNRAKEMVLGVPEAILAQHGAVSEQVARAMADGALTASGADVSVSVTGIAGPSGGSASKPVGLVHFAAALRGGTMLTREFRFGDLGRTEIRRRSVLAALELIEELLRTR
jgi:nicotinamide-nucleotide amidase